MSDSREGSCGPPWRRLVVALALAPAAAWLLTAAAPAAPAPTISPPTISPSPAPQGKLQVRKTDPSGALVLVAGATFNVHRNTPDGTVVKVLTTDNTGTTSADLDAALDGTTYCVEEIGAPPGFQLAPTYTPKNGCIPVTPEHTSPPISVADPPLPTPPPSTPTPTPSPTPAPTGEVQVVKVDTGNQAVTTPGFTFDIRVGSASGQVIATIATDSSGTAVAGALNPATYCVEEVSAPDGWQVAPTYSPSDCVAVAGDPTQGHNPTTVTVADPPAATPTPSAAGAGPTSTPSPRPRPTPGEPTAAGLPVAAVARGLVGLGALLLAAGALLIWLAIRRRRRRREPPEDLPADVWYDSTIT